MSQSRAVMQNEPRYPTDTNKRNVLKYHANDQSFTLILMFSQCAVPPGAHGWPQGPGALV